MDSGFEYFFSKSANPSTFQDLEARFFGSHSLSFELTLAIIHKPEAYFFKIDNHRVTIYNNVATSS